MTRSIAVLVDFYWRRGPSNPLEYKPDAFVGAREKMMMERLKAAARPVCALI
jgi:hypothetical protein